MRVDAGAAVQRVVAGAAGQRVVAPRRRSSDVVAGAADDVLDRRPACRCRSAGCCAVPAGERDGGVGGGLRQVVGVVAGAAGVLVVAVADGGDEDVVAAAAVQRVVADAAGDGVGELVAGQRQAGGAGDGEEFDLRTGCQRVVGAGQHGVGAFADGLGHHVERVVDEVGVVAGAAGHAVGAGAADQRVVAGAADQRVVAGAADDGVGEVVAGQRQAGGPAGGAGTRCRTPPPGCS